MHLRGDRDIYHRQIYTRNVRREFFYVNESNWCCAPQNTGIPGPLSINLVTKRTDSRCPWTFKHLFSSFQLYILRHSTTFPLNTERPYHNDNGI